MNKPALPVLIPIWRVCHVINGREVFTMEKVQQSLNLSPLPGCLKVEQAVPE
jgi:hypothetical protein